MKLTRIDPDSLSSKEKEIYNFQKVAAELADYGFNCIKLADDWNGADFLAYHKDGHETIKVQLKGRLTIAKKYIEKDLAVTFPVKGCWYLVYHDALVEYLGENTNFLNTKSWTTHGIYHSATPSKSVLGWLEPSKL